GFDSGADCQVFGGAQPGIGAQLPDQDDAIALLAESNPAVARHIRNDTEHSDDRGRMDWAGRTFVVERDVAADYRQVQLAAGVRDAAHRLAELVVAVRLVRAAEVQAVRNDARLGAGAAEVPRRL